MKFNHIFGLLLIALIAQTTTALAADRPITDIICDMGNSTIEQVRDEAAYQAQYDQPKVRSTVVQTIRFSGTFTPTDSDKAILIFSDDGCRVTINGVVVFDRFQKGQHLPNLIKSLYLLPTYLEKGKPVEIVVEYSNIFYTGEGDMDGVTLFLIDQSTDYHMCSEVCHHAGLHPTVAIGEVHHVKLTDWKITSWGGRKYSAYFLNAEGKKDSFRFDAVSVTITSSNTPPDRHYIVSNAANVGSITTKTKPEFGFTETVLATLTVAGINAGPATLTLIDANDAKKSNIVQNQNAAGQVDSRRTIVVEAGQMTPSTVTLLSGRTLTLVVSTNPASVSWPMIADSPEGAKWPTVGTQTSVAGILEIVSITRAPGVAFITVQANATLTGQVTVTANVGTSSVSTTLTITRPHMVAMKVSHNQPNGELPKSEQESVGAFVPLNNDDDDYEGTEDRNQAGAIPGESDLLPIVLKKIEPVALGGNYTLTIPPNVKIWKNGTNRTDQVTDTTALPANADTTLYAEGITAASGLIKLNWSNNTLAFADCDQIKISVFTFSGPLNVPGYSIHRYSVPQSEVLTDSKWLDPENGEIKEGSGTSDVKILWHEGANNTGVIGKPKYKVNDNYIWDMAVNVVGVKIENPTGFATPFAIGTITEHPIAHQGTIGGYLIKPVLGQGPPPTISAAIDWGAKVTLSGAGANGNRGVKEMRVGFIQNLTAVTMRGIYNEQGITLKAHMETITPLIDYVDGEAGPWYSTNPAVFFNPSATNTALIVGNDKPTGQVPLLHNMGTDDANIVGDVVDILKWQYDFQLDVCVQTMDSRNAANASYSRRASVNWLINGDGSVGQTSPFTWSPAGTSKIQIGSGAAPPPGWTPIIDGTQPPKREGPTVNDEKKKLTFSQ